MGAGLNNNVFGKQSHILHCIIFIPLVLLGNQIWLHAAVSLCIILEREFLIWLNINHEYIIILACFIAFAVTHLNQNTFDDII